MPHASAAAEVTVVHDYVTQRGGAERVALLLASSFGDRRLITSVYVPDAAFPDFAELDVQEILPILPRRIKTSRGILLLLLGPAFLLHTRQAGVALCSSSGWSHWIRAERKIVYCYTPPRWLYAADDFFLGVPRYIRGALTPLLAVLRLADRQRARSADLYIAISSVTQVRIEKAYGIRAPILFPPVALEAHGPCERVPGVEPGSYFLNVSRPRSYKNSQALVEAFSGAPECVVLVGGNAGSTEHNPQVRHVGRVTDAQLRWLYANCLAVIALSYEDFGLTPVEGHLFGKPSIVLRAGGYLDTCSDANAIFVEDVTPRAIRAALSAFRDRVFDPDTIKGGAARFAPAEFRRQMQALLFRDALAR